ncbi:DnaJ subfamily C member 22 [Orchesella cincta]|uniref:DnaJ homolog subfamily C member 22 n=1 Tax=Orchesella cincta TaxID=48709 RepID=A0A1D2MYZ4_ORCCI|nr:DnaJ subfamily C member 22 [Orchesella cincta]
MGKSLVIAYILWAIGGWLGLHHFYLGRDRQAFVWWTLVGGYGGVGLIVDFFRLSRYVEYANYSPKYQDAIRQKMKDSLKPNFSFYRFAGQIVFGNLLSWVVYRAIPEEDVLGVNLWWLIVLVPLGSAIGVHVIGNIGSQEGSILPSLLAAYIALPFYTMPNPKYNWSTWLAALAFRFSVRWRKGKPQKRHFCKRIATMSACGVLYLSLWTSYMYYNLRITNEHGESIHFRDSVANLVNSPMFRELRDSLRHLWKYYKVHGWQTLWNEIITQLDPMGERNALTTLELGYGATQEEITQKWRKLSKTWHPDKYRDPDEKEEAQKKFMEIQDAYDRISTLHSRRKKMNSKPRTEDEGPEEVKVEL